MSAPPETIQGWALPPLATRLGLREPPALRGLDAEVY
jgi:hypothetical protein